MVLDELYCQHHWFHLRMEAGGFLNLVFVLNIDENEKIPCKCW